MKKVFVIICFIFLGGLFVATFVSANTAQQTALDGLATTNAQAQMSQGDPAQSIGAAIGVLLSILGLIFLIIVIYAGIMWMTASGDSAKVEKARKMLIEGAVGLAITLAAYAFTAFVVNQLTTEILPAAPEAEETTS